MSLRPNSIGRFDRSFPIHAISVLYLTPAAATGDLRASVAGLLPHDGEPLGVAIRQAGMLCSAPDWQSVV